MLDLKKLTSSLKFFKNSKIILNNVQITTYGGTRWQKKIAKLMKRAFLIINAATAFSMLSFFNKI